jgi:MoxR-like ATPase
MSDTHTIITVPNKSDLITADMATMHPTEFGPKLNEAFQALRPILVGQDEQLLQAMFALGAIEHVLWVAGPGVAKSMAAELIMSLFPDADTLKLQLTKDMPQEAIFGHIVAKDLIEQGIERRNLEGGAGDVHFFFADEVMDASSWTLRTLLNLINERKLRSKSEGEIDAPLHSVIATTNFFRTTGELEAVVDRFLARAIMPAASDIVDHFRIGRGYTRTSGRQFVTPQLNYADLLAFGQWIESPESVEIPNSMMLLHYELMLEFRRMRHEAALERWAKKNGTDLTQQDVSFEVPSRRDLGVEITPRTAAKAIDFVEVSAGIDGREHLLASDLRAAGLVYCVLGDGSGDSELWNEVCNGLVGGLNDKHMDALNAIGSLVDFVGDLRAERGIPTQGEFMIGGQLIAVTRQNLLQLRQGSLGFRNPHPAIKVALVHLDECIAKLDEATHKTGICVPGWQ